MDWTPFKINGTWSWERRNRCTTWSPLESREKKQKGYFLADQTSKMSRCLIFLRMVSKNAWVWKTFNFWILHTVVIHHPCIRTTTHYDTNVSTVTFLSLKGKKCVECTYLLCKPKLYPQILFIKKKREKKILKLFLARRFRFTIQLKSAIKKTLAPQKSCEINTVKALICTSK